MAKAKTQLFSEISGSFKQGVTFRKLPNKAKQIFQRKPIPSYTRTDKQDNVRTGYRRLCDIWKKAEWLDKTVYTNFAGIYKITPFNAWMKFNMPIMSRKPVLYLGMDEGQGTTAHDYSEFENNGEIVGATWQKLSTGKHYLSFDGIDDHGLVPNIPNITELTIMFWIRTTETRNWKYPLSNEGNQPFSSGVKGWRFSLGIAGSQSNFDISESETNYSRVNGGAINDGKWHFMVLWWDGIIQRIYKDTKKKDEKTFSGDITNDLPIMLGVDYRLIGHARCDLCLVRIIAKAIPEEAFIKAFEIERHLFGV